MKKILIGQIMLWTNIGLLIAGNKLLESFEVAQYVFIIAGIVGVFSTGFNCVYAAATQIQGYKEMKIEL
jgi:small neutral amino acid transporter SnatA (MarC family)